MIDAQQLISSIDTLPTLPGSVARLFSVVSGDMWSAEDMEQIIAPDPALTANMLRLANSPLFGFTRKITTIRQAVTLMGIKRVFEVAASGAFARVIPPYMAGYDMKASDFWVHSIGTAMLAERLVILADLKVQPLIFTAGLLHDMGKLVMGAYVESEAHTIRSAMGDGCAFVQAEGNSLGTSHAEVGELLAKKWNLPEVVEVAARWHHDPENTPDPADQSLVDVVHIADALAHMLGYGSDSGGLMRQIVPGALQRVRVTERMLERVAAETFDQIQGVADYIARS